VGSNPTGTASKSPVIIVISGFFLTQIGPSPTDPPQLIQSGRTRAGATVAEN
jgi:hypothetical protein